jgi:hypothetical protein
MRSLDALPKGPQAAGPVCTLLEVPLVVLCRVDCRLGRLGNEIHS